jgi:cytidylate kinase
MGFKIIAIDGPTGVGKSTIARQLAMILKPIIFMFHVEQLANN